jgi:hypothetical protein
MIILIPQCSVCKKVQTLQKRLHFLCFIRIICSRGTAILYTYVGLECFPRTVGHKAHTNENKQKRS